MSKSLLSTVTILLAFSTVPSMGQQYRANRPARQGVIVQRQGVAPAAEWAKKLFTISKIDFGVIATGSDSKKFVRVKNVLQQTVVIQNATTTCGCSVATPSKNVLQPNEEAIIEVTMNTRRFKRRKDSNVIVTFSQPQFAEVRIPITAYIRTDVVFDPGMVQFGNLELGKGGKRQVKISYAGRADWVIKKLEVKNQFLSASFNETKRVGGRVDYTLDVMLKENTPMGRFRDLVILVTDDKNNPYVPLLVEANIEPDVVVTPGIVALNAVTPGQQIRKQVVIRGKAPFEIEKIESVNGIEGFQYRRPQNAKSVHVVQFSLTPANTVGKFEETFNIWITGRPQPVTFKATGEVIGDGARLGAR
ncbi:MAG: DUF1573 domain-containing protein [Planctomycetaceae bacterium]